MHSIHVSPRHKSTVVYGVTSSRLRNSCKSAGSGFWLHPSIAIFLSANVHTDLPQISECYWHLCVLFCTHKPNFQWIQRDCFTGRIQFKGDLVTTSPDIYQLDLGSDVEFIWLASDDLWDYIKRLVIYISRGWIILQHVLISVVLFRLKYTNVRGKLASIPALMQ